VSSRRDDVVVCLERVDGALQARIGTDTVAFAHARLEPVVADAAPQASPQPIGDSGPPPYQPDKLFHGPSWRVLSALATHAEGAEADVRPTHDLPRSAELIDAAFQLACTWADRTHGFLALPVGAGTIRWFGPADGPVRLQLHPRTDGDRVFADLVGLDAHGVVRMLGHDLELRRATAGENR
jgi:hypothetical protein